MIQTNLIQNAHADLVCDAAYDFYGTKLATAGLDQRIKIWRLDEQTGEWSVEDEWKAHDAAISRLSWAHPQHGQFIASASFDRTVRVWERSPSDVTEQGLNGLGANTRGSERWVERAQLTEAKGSVRSVEWAPKAFGMKVASISTDNHLRLYESLESGAGSTNVSASLMWSLVEEVDVPSLPLTSSVLSSSADPSAGIDTSASAAEPSGAAATTAPSAAPGTGSTSPHLGAMGSTTPSNAGIQRPGTGSREADGGWDLSWCKEPYWGEVCAVAAGVNGLVKVIQFSPAQRPKAVLILDPTPPKSPRAPAEQTPAAAPSYAHQARRSEKGSERESQLEAFAITTVAWAPSCGRSYHLIATGGRDGCVRVWKVRPPVSDTREDGDDATSEAGGWSATVVADFDDHKGPIGRVEWNITGTVLSSAGNDGKVRLWRSTYGNVWRPMGSLDVVHNDDAAGSGETVPE